MSEPAVPTDLIGLADRAGIVWPVTTERLRLRPVTPADSEATFAYRRRLEVHDWLTRAPTELADYRAQVETPERLASGLVVEHGAGDGAVIGDLMVRVESPWAQAEVAERAVATQAELGWAFDPARGGRGLATEAVRALLDLSLGPLGLRRVTASCFADNTPSWRLMERVGLRREAHTRADSLHRSRGWCDGYTYALLATEWPPQP